MDIKTVQKEWQGLSTAIEAVDYAVSGYDYNIQLDADNVRDFATMMLGQGFYLVDLMAVHVTPQIEVVYQFAHVETRCRIMARAFVAENGEIATISDIFQGANWHERETRDFHGVVFTDHPYLQPIILAEEDVDLKPLLKGEAALKHVDAVRRKPPEPKPQPKVEVTVAKSQEQS